MIDLTNEEWREIRSQIHEFEGSLLWESMVRTLQNRRASLLVDLDMPKTPENMTNYLRGSREGLRRAIITLEDLSRQANLALKPRSKGVKDG